jgi:regulator of RNase E activity RraA
MYKYNKMTKKKRRELLKAYEDLRVADVRDGMDWHMMHHYGTLAPEIRPLYRTTIFGIARTLRYLPYIGPVPWHKPEDYRGWVGHYYKEVNPYPWMDDIEEGDVIMIDQSGIDVGLMGSENSMGGLERGARGYVTNGFVRDTDELIIQKCPFWSTGMSQKMVQGRSVYDAHNIPVAIGGVQVRPNDMVVADGDGVIVVPSEIALDVAKYAHGEHDKDKVARAKHYKTLGLQPDDTLV